MNRILLFCGLLLITFSSSYAGVNLYRGDGDKAACAKLVSGFHTYSTVHDVTEVDWYWFGGGEYLVWYRDDVYVEYKDGIYSTRICIVDNGVVMLPAIL